MSRFACTAGAALGQGIGDQLTRLAALPDLPLLLLNPGIEVSTAAIFKKLNFRLTKPEKDSIIIRTYIKKRDILSIGENLYNLLEVPRFFQASGNRCAKNRVIYAARLLWRVDVRKRCDAVRYNA